MRKLSFFLLLATAAAPALAAQDQDHGRDRHRGNDSSEQSESRPQRSAESRGAEKDEQRAFRSQRSELSQASQQAAQGPTRAHFQQQDDQQSAMQSGGHEALRNRHRDGDGSAGSQVQGQSNWRERERHIRTIPDTQPTVHQPSRTERESFQARRHRDYNGGNYTRWTNHWRNDGRYDWYNWRNHHRSSFHIGFYYDPFGWNYRPWSIGSFLYPSYYGSRYWLNDPWQYRLPPAYGPYRWVRYWDDALLVNIYTGEVEDVIHNFFW